MKSNKNTVTPEEVETVSNLLDKMTLYGIYSKAKNIEPGETEYRYKLSESFRSFAGVMMRVCSPKETDDPFEFMMAVIIKFLSAERSRKEHIAGLPTWKKNTIKGFSVPDTTDQDIKLLNNIDEKEIVDMTISVLGVADLMTRGMK